MADPLSAGIASLKAAYDLSRVMLEVRDGVKLQATVFELQREILSAQGNAIEAQTAQFALIDEKRKIEEELANLKKWNGESEQYKLEEIARGVFAYAQKQDPEAAGTKHYLCANCFNDRRKSVLIRTFSDVGRRGFQHCPHCRTDFPIFGPGVEAIAH